MYMNHDKQSGMVSILTVLFLMVLLSVFTISFIKIVSDEQRQTTDNDLAASALAAAQSGIEDGKRIVMYCSSHPGPACDRMLASGDGEGDCSVFRDTNDSNMAQLRGDLGIAIGANGVSVGSAPYAQAYTCLTIKGTEDKIRLGAVDEGKFIVKSLTASRAFTKINISWRGDASATFAMRPTNSSFTSQTDWRTGSAPTKPMPPVLRAQFIPYTPNGSINLNDAERDSRTVYIVPTSDSVTMPVDLKTLDVRDATPGVLRPSPAAAPIAYVSCGQSNGYSCHKNIVGFDAGKSYYLRLALIYGGAANIDITAYDGTEKLSFNSQPTIEATGRANDVFKRIQAGVSPFTPNFVAPKYVMESANTVCKNIVVTSSTDTTSFGCDQLADNNYNVDGDPGIGPPPGNGGEPCWKKYGPMDKRCWRVRVMNFTTYSSDSLKGCYFDWGDGTTSPEHAGSTNYYPATNQYCQYKAIVPPYPGHQYDPLPPPHPRTFTVKIYVLLKDGSIKSASRTIKRPL